MSINAQTFSPTFKLVGNLQPDQILVYDASENAFVNAYSTGVAGDAPPITGITSVGLGEDIVSGITGNEVQLKKILAGDNIAITDNGASLVIRNTFNQEFQTGTNIGTGTGVFSRRNSSNTLEFKSLRATSGITVSDNGSTITFSLSDGGAGHLIASNNLSDLGSTTIARQNLGVASITELQSQFVSLTSHSVPDLTAAYDIGSPTNKFNDIYAETFQGVAVLADNLTISGNVADILVYDGQNWRAARPVDGGRTEAQYLDLQGTTLSISDGNSIELDFLEAEIEGLTADEVAKTLSVDTNWTILPASNNTHNLGSSTRRWAHLWLANGALHIGDAVLSVDAATGKLEFNNVEVFVGNNYNDLENKPTQLSQFTNDLGFITGTQLTTTYATKAYVDSAVSDIVGLAPAQLDTLGELADAIGDNPTLFTDIEASLNSKADAASLASVAQTGSYNDLIDAPIATTVEYFKINYATDGSIASITDRTGGIAGNVTSALGGIVEITFTGYSFPPAGAMIYGYAYATNEYVVTPITKDMTTRKLAGGGSAGAPTVFGNLGSLKLTLKLAESDTGASRQFGTTTHAWVMFSMIQ